MTTYPVGNYALTPVAGSLPSGQLFGIAYNYSNGSNNLATIDTSGGVASFYMFPSTDRYPGVPIYGADGNFYGVAQPNTVGQNAYLYKATPTGTATTVATLPFLMTDFVGQGAVLQGSDGNFYGVQSTGLGCSKGNPHGGVYKLTPDGQYTVLHDFGVCGNGIVNSLLEGSDGKLYGAIEGNSELFSLTKSGEYEALFAPSNGTTQGLCPCRLIQGSDGKIYGSAEGGGPGGFGVVFSLDVGLPPPAPQALKFAPQSGPPGTRVRIWGSNLLGASVEFGSFPGVSGKAHAPVRAYHGGNCSGGCYHWPDHSYDGGRHCRHAGGLHCRVRALLRPRREAGLSRVAKAGNLVLSEKCGEDFRLGLTR